MVSRKRREPIDLTGDDNDDTFSSSQSCANPSSRPPKQARIVVSHATNGSSPLTPGSSQANPFEILDDEEEDGSQEVADGSQDHTGSGFRDELYGKLETRIVGCRHYSGHATIGEFVVVRREPENPYDANAIQVLNVLRQQIGHIPRGNAAKLARFIDTGSITVEGIITGEKGYYECPIELRLYGPDEPVARENLITQMRRSGLPVGNASNRQRAEQRAERERQKASARAAKAAPRNLAIVDRNGQVSQLADFAGGSSQALGENALSLEDIIGTSSRFNPRNVERVVERFGVKEEDLAVMPKAAQPEALSTELHPFQLQALQWMLDKEIPQLPAQGSRNVVQLWQRHSTEQGLFTNLATNFSVHSPVLASGGILADDMGLGKTIQVLSLIMMDRALGRRAKDACDATLILAPVSVMSNWSTQIANHIKEEHVLRIMFYHGTRKQPITPKEIQNYDVVISTYDSVSYEWYSQKKPTVPRKSGVFSVKWRRVILDEGHNIRNPKAKKTIAATNIMAQSRWVLTGTPIINNLKDLFSLVRFLGLSGGLTELEVFHGAIIRPVSQGDERGNKALQLLMSGICLRRKKEMSFIDLRLPELSEYVHKITLLPHEQEKYDALEAQAKGTLDIYRQKIKVHGKAQDAYRHLLEVLLRMRQLCNHWKLVGEERLDSILKQLDAEGVLDLTEENKAALQRVLQIAIDSQEDCPVCLESLKEPVITKCGHIYCTPCIERVIDTQHKCPMCRTDLDSLATTTVKPAKEISVSSAPLTEEQLRDKESIEKEASSKVTALLSILHATAKDPSNKTIIFSQWTAFLDLLSPHLQSAGFKFTRIDGSMSALQRDASLQTFDNDAATTIMLASLSVCSVGLNLVSANHVLMADSWWAPAIEDQAVDRVHRLGQKRETKVFRLVVEGSVEERVLGIQEDKRKLMGLAFAEKEGGERRRKRAAGAGLADLERLLGGGNAQP